MRKFIFTLCVVLICTSCAVYASVFSDLPSRDCGQRDGGFGYLE